MHPIDIRNQTWKDIQCHVHADRARVWNAFLAHGPCTTREAAAKSGIPILTLRPRSTELLDMFLLELVGHCREGGIYAYVPATVAQQRFEKAKEALQPKPVNKVSSRFLQTFLF